MISPETLHQILEPQHLVQILGAIPIVFLITRQQAKAIFKRDTSTCQYPGIHTCKGKLTIHHIEGKEDTPDNLLTVCKYSHLEIIHNKNGNGYHPEDLRKIAIFNTEQARQNKWQFPK